MLHAVNYNWRVADDECCGDALELASHQESHHRTMSLPRHVCGILGTVLRPVEYPTASHPVRQDGG